MAEIWPHTFKLKTKNFVQPYLSHLLQTYLFDPNQKVEVWNLMHVVVWSKQTRSGPTKDVQVFEVWNLSVDI